MRLIFDNSRLRKQNNLTSHYSLLTIYFRWSKELPPFGNSQQSVHIPRYSFLIINYLFLISHYSSSAGRIITSFAFMLAPAKPTASAQSMTFGSTFHIPHFLLTFRPKARSYIHSAKKINKFILFCPRFYVTLQAVKKKIGIWE